MSRAVASTVIDQDPDVVWEALRDFTCVGRWIPGAHSCVLVPSDSPTNPHRRIVLGDGTAIDERLVTLDEPDRRIRYTITPPLPRGMRSFIGTARLLPITEGNRTFIEWMSEFDCDGALESRMVANISTQLRKIVLAVAQELDRGPGAA